MGRQRLVLDQRQAQLAQQADGKVSRWIRQHRTSARLSLLRSITHS